MLVNPHVPDLRRLSEEGFEMQIGQGYALLLHVPYLNSSKELCYGAFACPYSESAPPADHIMLFSGSMPCSTDGAEISALKLDTINLLINGYQFERRFSNKPYNLKGELPKFENYYDKFKHYLKVVCAPAIAIYPGTTAQTYHPLTAETDSPLVYSDTNASRANIINVNDKLINQKIGIIGLGGTGSFVLDHVAKTPVAEVHLYDGDILLQHNAFRAPGAVPKEIFPQKQKKAEYFKSVYSNMHRNIIAHGEYIDEENLSNLLDLDFVFICMDVGSIKPKIISALTDASVPFVDCGIYVELQETHLLGMVRCTIFMHDSDKCELIQHIPMSDNEENDIYSSNIQISELNAMAAILAVIRWKQYYGLYLDLKNSTNMVYTTTDGVLNHA